MFGRARLRARGAPGVVDRPAALGDELAAAQAAVDVVERAERGLRFLEALGFTREELLTRRRAQLEFQAPGFLEWLRRQTN